MKVTALIGRLGPWGDNESHRLDLTAHRFAPHSHAYANAVEHDIAEALHHEHPCDSPSCDISAAAANGFPLVAAALLRDATETDYVERLARLYQLPADLRNVPGWDAWCDWHATHATHCEACGGITYRTSHDAPASCGNCGADLPTDDDWPDADP